MNRRELLTGGAIGAIAGGAGCAAVDSYSNIPTPEHSGTIISYHIVKAYMIAHNKRIGSKQIPTYQILDDDYTVITKKYLKEYTKFFNNFIFYNTNMDTRPATANSGELDESTDCDNFALLYKGLAGSASWRDTKGVDITIGAMSVYQKNAAMGVPEGGAHMLNFAITEDSYYAIEPQTGRIMDFKEYKNPIFFYII